MSRHMASQMGLGFELELELESESSPASQSHNTQIQEEGEEEEREDEKVEAVIKDNSSKAPRLPRWTRQEILVLIEGKRVAETRVRRGRVAGLGVGGPLEPKWATVSAYCKRHGVNRGPVQCRKRWSNLAADFKKIRDWEDHHPQREGESFWLLRNDLRRHRRLPGFFDREVFDILAGDILPPSRRPPDDEEGCSSEAAAVVFDSGRSAAADKGLFSTEDDDDDDDDDQQQQQPAMAMAMAMAPPKPRAAIASSSSHPHNQMQLPLPLPVAAPTPLSEKQYEASDANANADTTSSSRGRGRRRATPPTPPPPPRSGNSEKQAAPDPPDIVNDQEGRKRRRASMEDDDAADGTDPLLQVLERNGSILSAHLEAHNINLKLDREERRDHTTSLVAVLSKLADALARIADKL